MIGVYKIVNRINNKCYVGSSIEIESRKYRHFYDLKKGNHHSIPLQRAVNKYGIDNFIFEVIETCNYFTVLDREQYWIDQLQPEYNTSLDAYNCTGVKHTAESSEKKRKYALENNVRPPESTWKDRQKVVYMLDYNTLEVKGEFSSLSEACRAIGRDHTYVTTISDCCNNLRYSAYGFRWVFDLKDIPNLRKKKR